jgi:hypothetical protein
LLTSPTRRHTARLDLRHIDRCDKAPQQLSHSLYDHPIQTGLLKCRQIRQQRSRPRQLTALEASALRPQQVTLWFKAEGKWITGLLGAGKLKHNFIHHQAPLPGLWQLVQLCVQLRQKPRQV